MVRNVQKAFPACVRSVKRGDVYYADFGRIEDAVGHDRSYIRIISQLLDDCKIIITSHSSYIVSYLDPSWIHVGMNRKPGVAEFFTFKKSGQKQLQQDAEEFHMCMGDYLFSLLTDSENNLDDYLECDVNE